MIELRENNGIVEVISPELSLKCDTARYIYIKTDGEYNRTNHQIPYGLSWYEKQRYLFVLFTRVQEYRNNNGENNQEVEENGV